MSHIIKVGHRATIDGVQYELLASFVSKRHSYFYLFKNKQRLRWLLFNKEHGFLLDEMTGATTKCWNQLVNQETNCNPLLRDEGAPNYTLQYKGNKYATYGWIEDEEVVSIEGEFPKSVCLKETVECAFLGSKERVIFIGYLSEQLKSIMFLRVSRKQFAEYLNVDVALLPKKSIPAVYVGLIMMSIFVVVIPGIIILARILYLQVY